MVRTHLFVIAIIAALIITSRGLLHVTTNSSLVDQRALARIATPPLGLPGIPVPDDNALTVAKVKLGRKLFSDRRLSSNNTMSCATCHVPEQAFTVNGSPHAVGIDGRSVGRNAPTLLNVAFQRSLFHDGRETNLAKQVFGPLLTPNEMGNPSMEFLSDKVHHLDDYAALFQEAFQRGPSGDTISQALASYERTLVSANTAFDRWYYGKQTDALGPRAQAGFRLFVGKARCALCHTMTPYYALFTDHAFHNTGVGSYRSMERATLGDIGRSAITLNPTDRWRYKTPTLRNVALTAPYMHDGSFATLEEVMRFYNRGGYDHPLLDPLIRPLQLTEENVEALVTFLESLTGDNIPELIADARTVSVGNPTGVHHP